MKFSIVTPVLNCAQFVEETMNSVLSQEGDFDIEYIVRDGGSSDGTLEKITTTEERVRMGMFPRRCRSITMSVVSASDKGMYDALNKGFESATGDICAYINADDTYLPGAFEMIRKVCERFPFMQWVKGITMYKHEDSPSVQPGFCYVYQQDWLARGLYGRFAYFVQQDSVFWRRDLLSCAGGFNPAYRYAGDYDLWIRFAREAPLYSVNAPVSVFRHRFGQLSQASEKYQHEQLSCIPKKVSLVVAPAVFFWMRNHLPRSFRHFFDALYPWLFWTRTVSYVDIDAMNNPVIRSTKCFIAV